MEPEQIGGCLQAESRSGISHETVYYASKRIGACCGRTCAVRSTEVPGKPPSSAGDRESGRTQDRLYLDREVERKTAQQAGLAMVGLLPYWRQVHAITQDNVRLLVGHEEIASWLRADVYFAHSYAIWERGTNENANGLIRQYFPNNRDFTSITQQEIDMAMARLNNRPRKRLGYQTPNQVFSGLSCVALQI